MTTNRLLLILLAFAILPAAAQKAPKLDPPALHEMVESERAFAAMGAELGVYDSFFKYFGEDGIGFNPHPGKFREGARKNPPPTPRPARQWKLEWWPVYGDVAESGDLGYNTGPTLFTDLTPQKRPSGHGYFFSVWKKQADGTWNVVVDMGCESPAVDPAHQDRSRYERAPQERYKKVPPRDAAAGRAELMKVEASFLASATKNGAHRAYVEFLAPHARVHRWGFFPFVGRDAALKYFDEIKLSIVQSEGIDGGISASSELGYTYGRYEIKKIVNGAERTEKGYFTHVWKRDAKGDWKLVADVNNNPLREGQ